MSTLFIVIIYCEAYSEGWDEKFKSYLKMLKTGKEETGQRHTQRYVGSMVGDVSIEYCLFKCCVSYDMIAFRNPKIEYCQKLTTANSFTKIKTMLHQVHRTLMYGGIFCCPSDTEVHHKGNLQLVYKSNPMVYILWNMLAVRLPMDMLICCRCNQIMFMNEVLVLWAVGRIWMR